MFLWKIYKITQQLLLEKGSIVETVLILEEK